jgi:hypothetical protein
MTGRDQARLLGLFFWLLTGFQLLMIGLIGFLYVAIFGAVFASVPTKKGDPPPEFILAVVVAVVAILFVTTILFAIPKIVAGYGLRNEKKWARIWTIIACCMAVMSFPLGTAVGVFGLVFMFGDTGKAYFDSLDSGRLSTGRSMAPPPNSWQ